MTRQVVITIPEDGDLDEHADFVKYVAEAIEQGCTSGHFTRERHWKVVES